MHLCLAHTGGHRSCSNSQNRLLKRQGFDTGYRNFPHIPIFSENGQIAGQRPGSKRTMIDDKHNFSFA